MLLSSMPNAGNDLIVTGSSPVVSATVCHIRPEAVAHKGQSVVRGGHPTDSKTAIGSR